MWTTCRLPGVITLRAALTAAAALGLSAGVGVSCLFLVGEGVKLAPRLCEGEAA